LTGAISRKHQEKLSRVHKETQYKEIVCTGNYWSGMLTASSNFGKLLDIEDQIPYMKNFSLQHCHETGISKQLVDFSQIFFPR
jgi:hypothetical protein